MLIITNKYIFPRDVPLRTILTLLLFPSRAEPNEWITSLHPQKKSMAALTLGPIPHIIPIYCSLASPASFGLTVRV